eukprot:c27072_g1_i1.p1 GENE.c27072_g1_i1~~c27072_g1_i1.p1  ORF type:complete len:151 (-),score=36.94 c27072_g1_i1:116-568(-)
MGLYVQSSQKMTDMDNALFRGRITDSTSSILTSYKHMITCCSLEDNQDHEIEAANLRLQVHAAELSNHCQNLLVLTRELKTALLIEHAKAVYHSPSSVNCNQKDLAISSDANLEKLTQTFVLSGTTTETAKKLSQNNNTNTNNQNLAPTQ